MSTNTQLFHHHHHYPKKVSPRVLASSEKGPLVSKQQLALCSLYDVKNARDQLFLNPSFRSCPKLKFEFPFTLHSLLEDAAHDGHEHIVSWLPHGRAFKIHSKQHFEIYILPRYYKKSKTPKYRSFTRQLAVYGFQFKWDMTSPDRGTFSHPLMVRGKPELCLGMSRQRIKGPSTPASKLLSSSSCAASAAVYNNSTNPAQQSIVFIEPVVNVSSSGFGVLREEEEEEVPRISAGEWEETAAILSDYAVSKSDVGYQQEEEYETILLPMSDDDRCHEADLLAFAIHCNNYLIATRRTTTTSPRPSSPQSSPLIEDDHHAAAKNHNPPAENFLAVCSSSTTTILGNNNNNTGGRRWCSWAMSEQPAVLPSSDHHHQQESYYYYNSTTSTSSTF